MPASWRAGNLPRQSALDVTKQLTMIRNPSRRLRRRRTVYPLKFPRGELRKQGSPLRVRSWTRPVSGRGLAAQLQRQCFRNQASRHRVGLVANQDVHRILVSHRSRYFPAHVRGGLQPDPLKLPVAYLQHHVLAGEIFLDSLERSTIESDKKLPVNND